MKRQHPQKAARRVGQESKVVQKKSSRRRGQKGSKPLPKQNLKRKRRTPLPPRCPVHDSPMLVNHVSGARQYRYCVVEGCRQSTSTFRPIKPKTTDSRLLANSPPSQGGVRGGPSRAKTCVLSEAVPGVRLEIDLFPEYCI